MINIDNIIPENRDSENSNENSSKKEDIFSFGVRTNEKDEKESFTDGEEDKDNLEKDGSDDDKKDKKDSFGNGLHDSMKDEMDASDKQIVFIMISIKSSDIKSAKGGGTVKVPAEKLTKYQDNTSKTENIEVDMSQEQVKEVMDEIKKNKGESLLDSLKGLFGLGGENGNEVEGQHGDEVEGQQNKEEIQKAIDSMKDFVLEDEKNDGSNSQNLNFVNNKKPPNKPNEGVTR
jgi:hypothetical protein